MAGCGVTDLDKRVSNLSHRLLRAIGSWQVLMSAPQGVCLHIALRPQVISCFIKVSLNNILFRPGLSQFQSTLLETAFGRACPLFFNHRLGPCSHGQVTHWPAR